MPKKTRFSAKTCLQLTFAAWELPEVDLRQLPWIVSGTLSHGTYPPPIQAQHERMHGVVRYRVRNEF